MILPDPTPPSPSSTALPCVPSRRTPLRRGLSSQRQLFAAASDAVPPCRPMLPRRTPFRPPLSCLQARCCSATAPPPERCPHAPLRRHRFANCCVCLVCQRISQQYCFLRLNQHQPPANSQSAILFFHNKSPTAKPQLSEHSECLPPSRPLCPTPPRALLP